MSDQILREEVLQFGDDARLFGLLTVPQRCAQKQPVFVFLSAGFLPRVGPMRLYVRLARTLALSGFISFRVDLSGRGDSNGRAELRNEQSLLADYREIVSILEARLGQSQFVLGGLCSGADNALVLAQADQRVVGLLLVDPTCYPDDGFRVRKLFRKYTKVARYVVWLRWRVGLLMGLREERANDEQLYTPLASGDLPTLEQMRAAFQAVCGRKGRVLSVFTNEAEEHGCYNQLGQLGRVLQLPDYAQYCTERFYPAAAHTFQLEQHRRRLLDEVKEWADGFLQP